MDPITYLDSKVDETLEQLKAINEALKEVATELQKWDV